MARLSVSRGAKKDLQDIFAYIARDNLTAARRMLSRFNETFRALAAQPGIGRRRDELKYGYQPFSRQLRDLLPICEKCRKDYSSCTWGLRHSQPL